MKKQFMTLATLLTTKMLSFDAFEKMDDAQKASLHKEVSDNNAEYFKELEALAGESFKAAIEELKSKDLEAIKTEIVSLESKIMAKLEEPKANTPNKVEELKSKLEAIKNLSNGNGEVELKALTVRASIDGNQQSVMLPDAGQLATRRLSMYEAFPKITVGKGNHNGTITYYDWDEDTIARAATTIAEGVAFPESTAKFKKYSIPLQKIGDTLPVTEEFMEDAEMFAAELENFILTNVALTIDNQICNGGGTGTNLKGLFASVPAFNAALVSKVADAQFYDLLAVAQEQITTTGGAKYQPNAVFMRKSMINKLRLSKDANENYIIPPFVSQDGREVDSMVVIESNIVPANQCVLGDTRFGRIYEMAGVTLSRDTINQQFIEDEMTLKVRKRLAFLIRHVDRTGFVKITDVNAAITAITAS